MQATLWCDSGSDQVSHDFAFSQQLSIITTALSTHRSLPRVTPKCLALRAAGYFPARPWGVSLGARPHEMPILLTQRAPTMSSAVMSGRWVVGPAQSAG